MEKPLFVLTAAMILAAVRPAQSITIGQGPAIGTDKRGATRYQEFQDWTSNDVRALDVNNDEYKFNNANDPGRIFPARR